MSCFFYSLLYTLGLRKDCERIVIKDNLSFYDIVKRVIKRHKSKDKKNIKPPRTVVNFFKNTNFTEINIDTTESEVEEEDITCNKSFWNFINNWLYTIFVFIILCIQPIYTLYYIISNDTGEDIPYLASFFFQLIPPTQYYYAIRYWSTDHFEDFYYDQTNRYTLNKITYVIIFMTVLNTVVNIIRLLHIGYDGEFAEFHSLEIIPKYIIFSTMLISWIYGNLILFTNLSSFCVVFDKHKTIISDFAQDILDEECVYTVNEITVNMMTLVYELKLSIGRFEKMFSSFTFLGAISFGLFLNRIRLGNLSFFPWNLFITYVIMQTMFFWVILAMNGRRNAMSDFITHPKYSQKYIKRLSYDDIKNHYPTREEKELLIINLAEENGSIADWNSLDRLLDKDWTEFKFFGINIADFELIKRGMALIGIILGLNAILNGTITA